MTIWKDKEGLLHPEPQPSSSTNGLEYTCLEALLKLEKGEFTSEDKVNLCRTIDLHRIAPGEYSQTPWNKEDPASHDNTTAMVAVSVRLDLSYHKDLKILGKFWHPKDVAFYNYCKGGWNKRLLGNPFIWVTKLAQFSTCNDTYKKRPHGTFVDTDGKLLTVCRCLGVKSFRKTFHTCTKIIKKHTHIWDYEKGEFVNISRWDLIAEHYFKNKYNPINLHMGDMYWDY